MSGSSRALPRSSRLRQDAWSNPPSIPDSSQLRRLLLVRPTASGGLDAHADHEHQLLEKSGWEVDDADLRIGSRPRLRADFAAVRRLRAAAQHVDAVHAHGLRAGALAALALGRRERAGRRVPFVVTLHNQPVGGRITRLIGALLLRIAARRADVVLAVSPDLEESARRAGAHRVERAIIPIPSPHRLPREKSAGTRPERALEDTQALCVVVLARLAPQKGLDDLLDAVGILRGQRVAVQVDIAGEGPLRARLTRRIAEENLPVRLLGHRDDIAALLEQADLVVSAAHWEGQPIAVQETLRAARPLIATDAGGTRWVTTDAATLVPVGNPPALAAEIHRHRDQDVRSRAAHAAWQRATELPGEEDLRRQLHRLFSQS